ncbi:hypothetical protein MBLNU13_g03281t1 [Cladosporium sp. NU13]
MSDNLDAQPGGRLLKLPSEVRLLIYEYVFPPCKVDIHAPREREGVDGDELHAERADIAPLLTCRTIHAEAAPILYENTEFFIRFACSGPDVQSMKAGKYRIYAQVLRDLRGRVRSLIKQARKVSLSIWFSDSSAWEAAERKWFRKLTSELTRLAKAPKLKQLHITFEADDYSRPALNVLPAMNKQFDRVLRVLSEVELRATVTTAIHPSIEPTDIRLSTYFDTPEKMPWTDTTQEVYSKRLARLSTRRSHLENEIRLRREWIDFQDSGYFVELDFHRLHMSYLDADTLVQMTRSGDDWIDEVLAEIPSLEAEHEDLHIEIGNIEGLLEWIANVCVAPAKRK